MERRIKNKFSSVIVLTGLLTLGLNAGVPIDLEYPNGKLTDAKKVMDNVYYVNHFFAFKIQEQY